MGLYIVDRSGKTIGWVDTNTEANDLLTTVPDDIYTFFVGGLPDEVSAFMLSLNTADSSGFSFFDRLRSKYGRVPTSINPLKEIKDTFLRHNTFFIKIRGSILTDKTVGQMFSVLRRTLPAGSAFFVLLERNIVEEGLIGTVDEVADIFYVVDVEDSHTKFYERQIAGHVR